MERNRQTDRGRRPQRAVSTIRAWAIVAATVSLVGACSGGNPPTEAITGSNAVVATTSVSTSTSAATTSVSTSTSVATTSVSTSTAVATTSDGTNVSIPNASIPSTPPLDPFECPVDHPGEWVIGPGAGDGPADNVPFVVLNGRWYQASWSETSVPAAAVGEQVAEVCFNLTDMRFEPGTFQVTTPADLPDGDGDGVAAGTPIHAFVGGDSMLRLAVLTINGWQTFEVFDVADAATPAQLVDLGGPFAAIVVSRWEGDIELMRVDDPAEVASLIDALRDSRLLESPFPAGEAAFSIDLVRPDGTITRRFVDLLSERLSPRIVLPASWVALLQAAPDAG